MKSVFFSWFTPLNIYKISGTICCEKMHKSSHSNSLVKHNYCYNAKTLFEANTLVLWGTLSPKLVKSIYSYLQYLPKHHALIHLSGCNKDQMLKDIPHAQIIHKCELTKPEEFQVISEVRRCLRV